MLRDQPGVYFGSFTLTMRGDTVFYYLLNDNVLVSLEQYPGLPEISESEAKKYQGIIYFLFHQDPERFRRSFAVTDPSLDFLKEDLSFPKPLSAILRV